MKKNFNLTGIVTQGRYGCCQEWVESYRILYSDDCNSWRALDSKSGAVGRFVIHIAFSPFVFNMNTLITLCVVNNRRALTYDSP